MSSNQEVEVEGAKALAAFMAYRDLGVNRSIRALAEKMGRSVGLLYRWSSKFEWVRRARAFDLGVDEQLQFAERMELKSIAANWATRMMQGREADWEMGERLRKEAERILTDPLRKATVADAVRAIELAAKLQTAACEIAEYQREDGFMPRDSRTRKLEEAALAKLTLSELNVMEGLLRKMYGNDAGKDEELDRAIEAKTHGTVTIRGVSGVNIILPIVRDGTSAELTKSPCEQAAIPLNCAPHNAGPLISGQATQTNS